MATIADREQSMSTTGSNFALSKPRPRSRAKGVMHSAQAAQHLPNPRFLDQVCSPPWHIKPGQESHRCSSKKGGRTRKSPGQSCQCATNHAKRFASGEGNEAIGSTTAREKPNASGRGTVRQHKHKLQRIQTHRRATLFPGRAEEKGILGER